MSPRDWFVIGSVVVVLLVAGVASILGMSNMSSNAMTGTQPYLVETYPSPTTPDQEAVLDAVSSCMTHYSKIDPVLWGQNGFDTTPLSVMDAPQRQSAAALIRNRLEVPCLAYGRYSAQRPGQQGPASHLSPEKYMEVAAQLGMDVSGAQQWYQERLAPRQ